MHNNELIILKVNILIHEIEATPGKWDAGVIYPIHTHKNYRIVCENNHAKYYT